MAKVVPGRAGARGEGGPGIRRRALAALLASAPWRGVVGADGGELVRYGGDAAFAPFESLDDQGQPVGFQIELLAELGRVLGLRFEFTLQPWAQAEAAFRAGRLDVVAMVPTPPRRAWALFTRGHASPAFGVYHRRDRPEPQDLQDLDDLRLAVLDGEPMRHSLIQWDGPIEYLPDAQAVLQAVQQRRADAALLLRAYGDPVLAERRLPDVVAGDYVLRLQAYALAVAPGREALRDRLQQGLDALEADGRLEALRRRWLASHRDLAERDALQRERLQAWGMGAATLLALGGALAALRARGRRLAGERVRRQDAEQRLQQAEQVLATAFTRHPEPMLVIELDGGVVRDANDALLHLLGLEAAQLIGQPLASVPGLVDPATLAGLAALMSEDGRLDAVPLALRRADGSHRRCLLSADRMRIGDVVHAFALVRDVTERLEQDEALREGYERFAAEVAASQRERDAAREAQVRAEQALAVFTQGVSHDLKAPVRAVQGLAGLLRARLQAGHLDEALACTAHLDRAAQRMQAMIGALARLAQVGQAPLQRRRVDMAQLVQDTCRMLEAAYPARALQRRVDELPAVQADAELVAQVWQNLLDNAWKYTAARQPARIAVDSHRDARGLWFRVADNGEGFDQAAAADTLFQPFRRQHADPRYAGTGIGLSLVKRIVDHHGGEVRVRSTRGVGTVVEFTLDAAPAPSAAG